MITSLTIHVSQFAHNSKQTRKLTNSDSISVKKFQKSFLEFLYTDWYQSNRTEKYTTSWCQNFDIYLTNHHCSYILMVIAHLCIAIHILSTGGPQVILINGNSLINLKPTRKWTRDFWNFFTLIESDFTISCILMHI
jgi:hypothetical protein